LVLDHDVQMLVRLDVERREVVKFMVLLQVHERGQWRNVQMFDCSHEGKIDRHRYSREGDKGPAENFHGGRVSEAFKEARELIRSDFERMIREWRH
jgi:hypothetical protein